MKNLIYDFFTAYGVAILGFLLIACVGVFIIFYALHINGKKETEIDGEKVLIKTLPLWNQMLRVSVPILFAVFLICVSLSQMLPIVDFVIKGSRGNYEEVQGTIDNMVQLRNDYRDTELYDLSFTVDGAVFRNMMNSFEPKDAQLLRNDLEIIVQYGYVNGQLTIYRIYTMGETS